MSLGAVTISDWLLILATLSGPIVAVQVQKWVERNRERRDRKFRVFQTLMATRAIRAGSFDHVQALNLIELYFNGKSASDKAVRAAWDDYRDFLLQKVRTDMTEAEAEAYNGRGIDLLVDTLAAMSTALGYEFNKVTIKRGGYYPQGHADESAANAAVRNGFAKMMKGEFALPMNVVGFPVSQEAIDSQKAINSALLKTLSGEAPLKIDPIKK